MAVTITISMPTAVESNGVYSISVEAIATDKDVEVARRTFSTSCSVTGDPKAVTPAAAIAEAAKAISEDILIWRKGMDQITLFAPMLEELKKVIEGRIV